MSFELVAVLLFTATASSPPMGCAEKAAARVEVRENYWQSLMQKCGGCILKQFRKAVFSLYMVPVFLSACFGPMAVAAAGVALAQGDNDIGVDIILVIETSSSMLKNEPDNLRS